MITKQPQTASYQISQFYNYSNHTSKKNITNSNTDMNSNNMNNMNMMNNNMNSQSHSQRGNRSKGKYTPETGGRDGDWGCQCNRVREFQEEGRDMFQCMSCQQNLEKVAQLKKANIILQYNNAKLQQQLQHLQTQNHNLKQTLQNTLPLPTHPSPSPSSISDLQSQLFQSKLLTQLLSLPLHPTPTLPQHTLIKIQDLALEKLVLQEQLEQKTRIIQGTVLYPIYHYDARVKFLRDCVRGLCGRLGRECRRVAEIGMGLRREVEEMRVAYRAEIQALYAQISLNCNKQNINTQNTPIIHKTTLTNPSNPNTTLKLQSTIHPHHPHHQSQPQIPQQNPKTKQKQSKSISKQKQKPKKMQQSCAKQTKQRKQRKQTKQVKQVKEIKQEKEDKFLRPCWKFKQVL